MSAPAPFRAELRAHNLHALGMAALSLLGALALWNLFYFFFMLLLLGFATAIHGDFGGKTPRWISVSAAIIASGLFAWGLFDHLRRRFLGTTDRAIIGWHLAGEFLLLPVRLTFAIGGNLSAIRWLSRAEQDLAWELLMTIHQAGRARIGGLSLVEPDPARLHRLLTALQFADYIDLHRGEDDWFYTVRSTRSAGLRALMPG